MEKRRLFARNIRARNSLDVFVVSAATSILALRFTLELAGYPSVGGARYHVAHMLWGGLIMLVAFIINFSFLGERVQRVVALLGGVGFGIFIDEVGKFVTKDNDYFFRPSVGIIYAIFVILYLSISFLTREQKLSNQEYQLNALRLFEEAIHNDMDIHERALTRQMLAHANKKDIVTQSLHDLLYQLPLAPPSRVGVLRRIRQQVARGYDRLWQAKNSRAIVRWFFVLETLLFISAMIGAIYSNFDDFQDLVNGTIDYGHSLVLGQAISTLVATGFVLNGLRLLRSSRLTAFEWFRRATLVNLLLTEFFIFSRIQFGAIWGFIFNLVLLISISAALNQERRYQEVHEAASGSR